MFNVGGAEVLVIALIALVVVGPDQLPSVLRKAGQYASQVRQMSNGLRQEFMAGADQLNPTKWSDDERGTGDADSPIVPRGYADRVAATDEDNPFTPKPVSQQMADPTPDEAAAEAVAAAEKAEAEAREALKKARELRSDARDKSKAAEGAGSESTEAAADSPSDAVVDDSAE